MVKFLLYSLLSTFVFWKSILTTIRPAVKQYWTSLKGITSQSEYKQHTQAKTCVLNWLRYYFYTDRDDCCVDEWSGKIPCRVNAALDKKKDGH